MHFVTRRIKSLPIAICAGIAVLLANANSAFASELTDEQEKFLAYLGQSWCVKERDGLGNEYLTKKIDLFSDISGDTVGNWVEFATRFESMYVADQIAMAMLPSRCKSLDFNSQHWRNASRMMDRMKSTPSYGSPPPPKAGHEEAWIRRWCSIGWRNYGEVHMDRCTKLIDKHM